MFVYSKVNKLNENGATEKVSELNRLRVEWIVYMNTEVTGKDEVMRGAVSAGMKR